MNEISLILLLNQLSQNPLLLDSRQHKLSQLRNQALIRVELGEFIKRHINGYSNKTGPKTFRGKGVLSQFFVWPQLNVDDLETAQSHTKVKVGIMNVVLVRYVVIKK